MNFKENKRNNTNFNSPLGVRGILLLLFFVQLVSAQSPKREVRATWLTTVWRLDWPSVTVPESTGTNEASREAAQNVQKSGLISVLDKLKAANFNTVFFQIRGMCDAFYNSQYEPWSQYLSSVRGADPGWDPLAFIIAEGHARGIEVHAWLNPYRYSSSAESHGNLPNDYATVHPEWLLDYGNSTKILNPGMPEVRQRISDVVADILTKYDVDGIVFDDYFYVDGITNAMDQQQFNQYNPKSLLRDDWRRENVNQMIKGVQTRINSIKPYITFGVSPAGVSASSTAVAAKYGVDPSPVGSDWQYNDIYSDPLAWLSQGSIDYISPQIYWTIGHATNDYSKLSPWWSKISNFFGRHFYSSNYSTFSSTELINEININRVADLNGVTGSVYFRTNNIPQTTFTAFKASPNISPALGAVYGWKDAPTQGLVENLFLSGQNLSWIYTDNIVRYSIYAIPRANINDTGIFSNAKYLIGVTYTKNFTLPTGINSASHLIAVAVYDRFGNEFAVRVLGENTAASVAASLTFPANNAKALIPCLFKWSAVGGADSYVWQVARDAQFADLVCSRETVQPQFFSGLQTNLKDNTDYYWRVRTRKANAVDSWSVGQKFTTDKFGIVSPANNASAVSLTPTISWDNVSATASYTVEIATSTDFSVAKTVFKQTTTNTSVTLSAGTLLSSTNYYVRVSVSDGILQATSETIVFTTQDAFIPIPQLTKPINGATLNGTSIEVCWAQQVSNGFRIELAKDAAFPARGTTLKTVDANTYCTTFEALTAATFFIRVKALTSTGLTEASNVASVVLSGQTSVPESYLANLKCFISSNNNQATNLVILSNETFNAQVSLFSLTGNLLLNKEINITNGQNIISLGNVNISNGAYILTIKSNLKTISYKIIN